MTPLLSLLLSGLPGGLWRHDAFGQHELELVTSFDHTVVVVDVTDGADKEQLLQQLASSLNFPSWFGNNWDALHDVLSDETLDPSLPDLIVVKAATTAGANESDLATLVDVCSDAARQDGPGYLFVGSAFESVRPLGQID